jgi:hypothetical protein
VKTLKIMAHYCIYMMFLRIQCSAVPFGVQQNFSSDWQLLPMHNGQGAEKKRKMIMYLSHPRASSAPPSPSLLLLRLLLFRCSTICSADQRLDAHLPGAHLPQECVHFGQLCAYLPLGRPLFLRFLLPALFQQLQLDVGKNIKGALARPFAVNVQMAAANLGQLNF